MTIDTTLPESDSLKFRKKSFNTLIKMKLTDELKILDDKIKANQAQYDLSKEAATISVLSSKTLDKYEYLTGEDLGYKPSALEKAKFEYSPLGMTLHKAFKTDEAKNIAKKSKGDFNYDGKYTFFEFYKMFYEFKDM